MAINNKDMILFEEGTDLVNKPKREMNELEIAGAVAYVYSSVREYEMLHFGECNTTFDSVNGDSYYCNKVLQLNDNEGYVLDYKDDKELILDHVFMIEGSLDVLWGYAYWHNPETDEEGDMFLIRI